MHKPIVLGRKRYASRKAKRNLARKLLRSIHRHRPLSPAHYTALVELKAQGFLVSLENQGRHEYVSVPKAGNVCQGYWTPPLALAA